MIRVFVFLLFVCIASSKKVDDIDAEIEAQLNIGSKSPEDLKAPELPGHLKPLGSSLDPLEVETRTDFPNPIQFFDKYVKTSKPIIIRGIAKTFPSFERMKNDSYLM